METRTESSYSPADVAVGAAGLALAGLVGAARRAAPLTRLLLDPPLVPTAVQPRRWLDVLGLRGSELRAAARPRAEEALDVLVPVLLEEVLRRAELTELVVRYVDVDAVVGAADLDAAAARLDVDAVARRLDIEAVLDRLDLTATVLRRVDLEVLAKAVLDRLDLTALVLERVDLARVAQEVIDAVDLPEIIRESTGSMASDTVRGTRMQGIAADEAVARVRDRLLLRRGPSVPSQGGLPQQPGSAP